MRCRLHFVSIAVVCFACLLSCGGTGGEDADDVIGADDGLQDEDVPSFGAGGALFTWLLDETCTLTSENCDSGAWLTLNAPNNLTLEADVTIPGKSTKVVGVIKSVVGSGVGVNLSSLAFSFFVSGSNAAKLNTYLGAPSKSPLVNLGLMLQYTTVAPPDTFTRLSFGANSLPSIIGVGMDGHMNLTVSSTPTHIAGKPYYNVQLTVRPVSASPVTLKGHRLVWIGPTGVKTQTDLDYYWGPSPSQCVISGVKYTTGTAMPGSSCKACVAPNSSTSWSPYPDNSSCVAANACTKNAICTGGTCGGTAYTCTPTLCVATSTCDGKGGCTETPKAAGSTCAAQGVDPCSTGACDGAGACVAKALPDGLNSACGMGKQCYAGKCSGGCIIGGVYQPAMKVNPLEPCQLCVPAKALSTWSSSPDGKSCGTGKVCKSGICTAQ